MEENNKDKQVFTTEQRAIILEALKDPEVKSEIIAILEEAGLLRE